MKLHALARIDELARERPFAERSNIKDCWARQYYAVVLDEGAKIGDTRS
jgi:hypothetical protein